MRCATVTYLRCYEGEFREETGRILHLRLPAFNKAKYRREAPTVLCTCTIQPSDDAVSVGVSA